MFKGSFDGVSRVFQDSFVILLFHSSHRSYPSRGRACFLFYFDGDGSLKDPIIKGVRGWKLDLGASVLALPIDSFCHFLPP